MRIKMKMSFKLSESRLNICEEMWISVWPEVFGNRTFNNQWVSIPW